MIGHDQQYRDHVRTIRRLRADSLLGSPRDSKPMSPELRQRLADRWERELAKSLAGEDVA